ncbi:MAG TPA: YebC/PmpR family DNA-binding transcriptional regulator [Chloroflexi bacterium]|nr:YebC/PmpR family DNA-binding transcriptional regulator [Chloroflexota bacterium]
MSGHSKWSTIKHKKAAADARRGKLFTQLAREITIAVREGGGNPEFNFRLRLAIDKAKTANMPKDNIERAIKRGTGELKGAVLEEIVYEAYAPHGVALMIQVLTDNRNRSVAELRRVLARQGGRMADAGAVAWQFERKGYIAVSPDGGDAEAVFEAAVEAGADDVIISDDMIEVFALPEDFQEVRRALENMGVQFETAELALIPKTTLRLDEGETLKVMGVINALEDLDDVQQVYSNLDISDEVMLKFEVAA